MREKIKNAFQVATSKRNIGLLGILLLAIALPVTVYLSQQQQTVQQHASAPITPPSLPAFPRLASIYSKFGHGTEENIDSGKVAISKYNLYVSDMVWWANLCGGDYNCKGHSTMTTGQYLKYLNPNQIDLMYQHSLFFPDFMKGTVDLTNYYMDMHWFLTYVGSTLNSNISTTDTVISVNDLSKFRTDNWAIIGGGPNQPIEMVRITGLSRGSGPGNLTIQRGIENEGGKYPAVNHANGEWVRMVVQAIGITGYRIMNVSSKCPTSTINPSFGSQNYNQFMASFWKTRLSNDPLYANLDGMFLDNFNSVQSQLIYTNGALQLDYENTNRITSSTAQQNYFSSGMTDYAFQMRKALPNKLIFANPGGDYVANSRYLNGGMHEGFDQNGYNKELYGYEAFNIYNKWVNSAASPQSFIMDASDSIAGIPNAQKDFKTMRYTLSLTLMNNGFYLYDEFLVTAVPGGLNGGGHQVTFWYDEFDNSGAGTGYLGNPLGGYTQPLSGVYRRDFNYGIVLVNTTGSSQTINLGGTYKKLLASGRCPDAVAVGNGSGELKNCPTDLQTVSATGNDGSILNSITLQPHDGIILLKSSGVNVSGYVLISPNSTSCPGASSTIYYADAQSPITASNFSANHNGLFAVLMKGINNASSTGYSLPAGNAQYAITMKAPNGYSFAQCDLYKNHTYSVDGSSATYTTTINNANDGAGGFWLYKNINTGSTTIPTSSVDLPLVKFVSSSTNQNFKTSQLISFSGNIQYTDKLKNMLVLVEKEDGSNATSWGCKTPFTITKWCQLPVTIINKGGNLADFSTSWTSASTAGTYYVSTTIYSNKNGIQCSGDPLYIGKYPIFGFSYCGDDSYLKINVQ